MRIKTQLGRCPARTMALSVAVAIASQCLPSVAHVAYLEQIKRILLPVTTDFGCCLLYLCKLLLLRLLFGLTPQKPSFVALPMGLD